jgi:hypothetical protein
LVFVDDLVLVDEPTRVATPRDNWKTSSMLQAVVTSADSRVVHREWVWAKHRAAACVSRPTG